mmetsp:Transcript_16305/g.63589  ORF Transcript_16305/g.63589 Transcript_16305/m.63589 type:complete len:244 (+) Transcript_16305:856-1587(+)
MRLIQPGQASMAIPLVCGRRMLDAKRTARTIGRHQPERYVDEVSVLPTRLAVLQGLVAAGWHPPRADEPAGAAAVGGPGVGTVVPRAQAAGRQDHAGPQAGGQPGGAVLGQRPRAVGRPGPGPGRGQADAAARRGGGTGAGRQGRQDQRRAAGRRRFARRRPGRPARGGRCPATLPQVQRQAGAGLRRQLRPARLFPRGPGQRGLSAPDGHGHARRLRPLAHLLQGRAGPAGRDGPCHQGRHL